jgi:hypothetical protein
MELKQYLLGTGRLILFPESKPLKQGVSKAVINYCHKIVDESEYKDVIRGTHKVHSVRGCISKEEIDARRRFYGVINPISSLSKLIRDTDLLHKAMDPKVPDELPDEEDNEGVEVENSSGAYVGSQSIHRHDSAEEGESSGY